MKKTLYVLFITMAVCSFTFSQVSRTHTTGSFSAAIFDEGRVGHAGSAGSGIVFDGHGDAMYRSSILLATPGTKAIGTFHANSGVGMSGEMVNVVPISDFTSIATHNQVATATFNTTGAPVANQIGVTVYQVSYSNTGDDFFTIKLFITNTSTATISDLYVGYFADWDVGGNNYTINRGGYIPEKNVAYQYENGGAIDPSYYGIAALSGASGARVTGENPTTNQALRDSAFVWLSSFGESSVTVDDDYRTYIGSGPYTLAAGETQIVGFAFIAGSDLADLDANAAAAITAWENYVVPVELSSFSAAAVNGNVELKWSTATEKNNNIFEIERKAADGEFVRIGHVKGAGTTAQAQQYSYFDSKVPAGKYTYRLKQIDFNGEFSYSKEVEVDVTAPVEFSLDQNYPNPFNPVTQINYSVDQSGLVKLTVYNVLGQQVKTLVNEVMDAGHYSISFDASGISSGTYFYKLENGSQFQVKKMIINK